MSRDPREEVRRIVEGPLVPAIWALAWPAMLQNVIMIVQTTVDHVMVGRFVGYEGNAALAVGMQLYILVMIAVRIVAGGQRILIARFMGGDDQPRAEQIYAQSILTAFSAYAVLLIPMALFLGPTLFDFVQAEEGVRGEGLDYFRYLVLGSLPAIFFELFSAAMRSSGDAKTPMRLGFVLTAVNIVANIILIPGLGPIPAFGTRGAAMGTVFAYLVVALLAGGLLASRKVALGLPRAAFRPDLPSIRTMLRFGIPLGLQGLALHASGTLMLRFMGSLPNSAEAHAAFAVSYTQLFVMVSFTSFAIMGAASTVAGQSIGAGKIDRAARVPGATALLMLALAGPPSLLFAFAPEIPLSLYGIEDSPAFPLSQDFLIYLAASCFFLPLALCYNAVLQGAGDTRATMWIMLLGQVLVPVGYCASKQLAGTLVASDIWLAIVLGHAARLALGAIRFRQGTWRSIHVD